MINDKTGKQQTNGENIVNTLTTLLMNDKISKTAKDLITFLLEDCDFNDLSSDTNRVTSLLFICSQICSNNLEMLSRLNKAALDNLVANGELEIMSIDDVMMEKLDASNKKNYN